MDPNALVRAFGLSSVVLLLAVIAIRVSGKIGMPSLLLYLGIGVLLGNAGLGIEFSNALLTEQLGLAALVFILAEGGLTTRWENVRPALGLGISLSTVAVVVSIAVAGVGVHFLLGYGWRTAFLWGAVLSSTDAAALFAVLRGIAVKRRLGAALELESGLNDPPVVIAVVLLAGTAAISWIDPLFAVYELVAGAIIGLGIGFGAGWWLKRFALPGAGLYPLVTLAVIGGCYAVGQLAHASGLLAAFVSGIVLGNVGVPHRASILSFSEGVAQLAQIGLFVLLGLYLDPNTVVDALVPGLIIGSFVLLVARPASVIAAATPFRVSARHQAFLSWSGLRGAVPIVLALIPLTMGRETSQELVNVVVVVVVIYTLVQGTLLPYVAKALGVLRPGNPLEMEVDAAPLEEIGAHVLQVTIPAGSAMHGVYLPELRLPRGVVVALVVRDGQALTLDPTIRLQEGDRLLIVTPEPQRAAAERRLRAVNKSGALARWLSAPRTPRPGEHRTGSGTMDQ